MKTSINKLRTELQDLILANANVNQFYWKDLNRAMAENRDINYPLVCAFYPTASLTMNQDRIQLTIDVADKIYQDYTNLNDVESDTLNVCRQLFNGLQSVRWKKIGRIESCSVRKFVATNSDFVAGHSMTIDFNLRDLNGVCDLPFFNYDFEQVVSGEATQVSVFNSDMSYSQIVDCGSSLELPDVTYAVKNSVNTTLAGATVPSVNNIETTLADVDNIDSDGLTVPTPAGVAFTCTPQIVCSDATAVLKNTVPTTLSTTPIASGASADIIAPDATATLNGGAFLSIPSGATQDIELVNQLDVAIVPDSVVGNKITVTTGGGTDADATAFLTATGIVDVTITDAVNALVISLKDNSIWTKMKAIYPMVGGDSTKHSFNLKNPLDFQLSFFGGWTHSSTGAQPNGTNSYADTGLNISTEYVDYLSSHHLSYYSRTVTTIGNGWCMGVGNTATGNPLFGLALRRASFPYDYIYDFGNVANNGRLSVSGTISSVADSFFCGTALSTTSRDFRRDSRQIVTSVLTVIGTPSNANIWLGAMNPYPAGLPLYINNECAFSSIGDGLTTDEVQKLYASIQLFNATLNRAV